MDRWDGVQGRAGTIRQLLSRDGFDTDGGEYGFDLWVLEPFGCERDALVIERDAVTVLVR